MPNTITNRQMFLMLFMTLIAVANINIPKIMAEKAGTGGWVAILLTAVLFAAAVAMWAKLNSLHQGKMLFDYGAELVGKAGAYFLAAYFAQYFLTVFVDLNISMTSLLQTNFLPNTPKWATALASIPVIGFVAYKGVTNVARLVEIYGVILLVVAIPVHLVELVQGDVNYILPLYNPAETGKVLSSIGSFIFSFLGIEVLAVIPFTAKNGPKAWKIASLAVLCVGVYYVLDAESTIMMIGFDEIVHHNYPLIAGIRQVEVPMLKVFQRLDLLYLTVGFIGLFSGLSIVYLNIVEFICRMLPKVRRTVVVALVAIVTFLAVRLLQEVGKIDQILTQVVTYSGIFAAGIVPAALLILTKVKGHGGKKAS